VTDKAISLRALACVAVLALATGCASTGGTSASTGATTSESRNLLTATQLATAGDINLYDAVNSLRPVFLRARPAPGTKLGTVVPTVYLDGLELREGLEALKSLHARNVQEVRFLEAQQANSRFGTQNNAGALLVTSKK
jgi:hypothetical protein